jgi:hypothetical protein
MIDAVVMASLGFIFALIATFFFDYFRRDDVLNEQNVKIDPFEQVSTKEGVKMITIGTLCVAILGVLTLASMEVVLWIFGLDQPPRSGGYYVPVGACGGWLLAKAIRRVFAFWRK